MDKTQSFTSLEGGKRNNNVSLPGAFPTNLDFAGHRQVAPLLDDVLQVDAGQRQADLADGVVLGEAVEVVDLHHQRGLGHLCLGKLQGRTHEIWGDGHNDSKGISLPGEQHPCTAPDGMKEPSAARAPYLESEALIEDGAQGLAVNLGLILLPHVRRQVDDNVRVRRAPIVHGLQISCLLHANLELERTMHEVTTWRRMGTSEKQASSQGRCHHTMSV